MTTPDVVLEIQTPVDGVFVLNMSDLNGPDDLATPGQTGLTWEPITCAATSIQVRRGGSRDGVSTKVDVGTLSASFLNGVIPTEDPNYRPGVPLRLRKATGDLPLFTGTTSDFSVSYEKASDNTRVNLSSVDAVQRLANTTRYGAANPTAEYETWQRRVERVVQNADVAVLTPTADGATVFGVNVGPMTDAEATAEYALWSGGTPMWSFTDGSRVLTFPYGSGETVHVPLTPRAVAGLVPGRVYAVTFGFEGVSSARYGVVGIGWSEAPATPTTFSQRLTYTFRATSTTHHLYLARAAGQAIAFTGVEIVTVPSVMCVNTVFESSIANHLDLTTNTARAGWYIDRTNTLRFVALDDSEPVAVHFSDVHDPGDPLHVCYTQAEVTYDTKAIVNDLSVTNHGRAWDADNSTWVADDTAHGPYVNLVSAATHGKRSSQIETSAANIVGTVYEHTTDWLGQTLVDEFADPHLVVHRVTFDATEYPDLAALLDIYSRVQVTHRSLTQIARIIGMEHDIRVDAHFVSLDLMED